MQTPCITTDLANNAIKAEHNVHILVGNTKEELIEAMKLLLEDHALKEKIEFNFNIKLILSTKYILNNFLQVTTFRN